MLLGTLATRLADLYSLVRLGVAVRFLGFCFIGLNAVVLTTAAFAVGTEWLQLPHAAAGFIAAQLATLWSYIFLEAWVFHNRTYARDPLVRMAHFFIVTNAAAAISAPLLLALSALGFSYLAANGLALVIVTVARFVAAEAWVWETARSDAYETEESPATTLLEQVRAARDAALRPTEIGSASSRHAESRG